MEEKKYILVVDDEEFFRDLVLRRLLTQYGDRFETLVAADGYEALEYMRSKDVALAVLDLRMSNLDGISVCRQAHEDGLLQKVPIIISSGFISEEDRAELESLGVSRFLHKPYSIDKLFDLIALIVD